VFVYTEPRSAQPHVARITASHRPLIPPPHLSPLLPIASALFSATAASQPLTYQSLPYSFYRNGGVPPLALSSSTAYPLSTCLPKPFRMNTCKSVSKQTTLTTFRMNTYEKHRGEGVLLLTRHPMKDVCPACPDPVGERPSEARGLCRNPAGDPYQACQERVGVLIPLLTFNFTTFDFQPLLRALPFASHGRSVRIPDVRYVS
jgi:hypothetical protein